MQDVHDLAIENRRHQRAERGAVAQRDGHAQRDAQVPHGQPERQPTQSPHGAEEIGPAQHDLQTAGRARQHDRPRLGTSSHASNAGAMIQLKTAADQPVGLPRPLADAAVRDVEAGRGQTAQPVEEDAEERIRIHMIGLLESGASLSQHRRLVLADLVQPGQADGHAFAAGSSGPTPRRAAAS